MPWLRDLKYAVRSLGRSPILTLVIILTLALGIGANIAIFTLINGLLLTPLPVRDPARLMLLGSGRSCCVNGIRGIPRDAGFFAYREYLELREQNPYFDGIAAVRAEKDMVAARFPGPASTALSFARLVSANYFEVIGSTPAFGRGFAPGDDVDQGAHPVVVISDRLSRREFGIAPLAVGQSVIINGAPYTIIGVAAPGFYGERLEADVPDFWIPLSMQPQVTARASFLEHGDTAWLYAFARLKPNVNPKEAETWTRTRIQNYLTEMLGSELTAETRTRISEIDFKFNPGEFGTSGIRHGYSTFLYSLMALVTLLLVICWFNIGNLLLARAIARSHEIVTRMAIGATRWRIIRQTLTESALLGIVGSALGLILAKFAVRGLLVLAFQNRYVPLNLAPEPRLLGFILGVSFFTTLAFGFVPALHASRVRLVPNLHPEFVQTGTRRFTLGSLLVVGQIAISLVLIIIAGLFIRTIQQLAAQNVGFNTQVIDASIDAGKTGYKPNQLELLYRRLTERLERVPGVESVALSQVAPFGGGIWSTNIEIPGIDSGRKTPNTRWLRVSPNFASTVGLQVMSGSDLGWRDSKRQRALVNHEFVKEFLGGANAIGQQVRNPGMGSYHIVGVVEDARLDSVTDEISPTLYVPLLDGVEKTVATGEPDDSIYAHDVLVRVSGNPAAAVESVRRGILEVDPNMAIRSVATLQDQVDRSISVYSAIEMLSSCCGMLSLLLASLGLYGLMSYGVARRSREMGIRLALGADRHSLVGMILRESTWLVVLGIVAGIPVAWIASRLVSSMLFGVAPADPLVFATASLVLGAVAATAVYFPSRRASRTDPALVLRTE